MQTPAILSIDIGSSSTRAALYDHRGQRLVDLASRREWSFAATTDGGSEMDAAPAFATVCGVIDELISRAAAIDIEITHIAISCFWHSLLGIDADGKPITPVLGWADTRSRECSGLLKREFDEAEVHDRTGAHFHSSFWPAKLLWLREENGTAYRTTARWMGFGDYVISRFTGEAVTSISMASATGVFDQRGCDWDDELLRYLSISSSQLPGIDPSRSLGLMQEFAARWPLLKNARVMPAIGDGAADHVGSCGVVNGNASLMVGTSAAMRVALQGPPPKHVPRGLWCYRVDEHRVIIGGALSDGGNLYQWWRSKVRLPDNVEEQIGQRDPAAHGLTVLPFFHGERSTGYRENARGAILGLKASHDATDILRAIMEAVAYRLAAIRDLLEMVAPIGKIVASGGALRDSTVWPQIIADALGHDLMLSEAEESALRGAALLAVESVVRIDAIDESTTGEGMVISSNDAFHAAHEAARERQEATISERYGDKK